MAAALDQPVAILGSGVAGLITAHTLIEDGFRNVTILTKDKSPGGVWAEERVYPGLTINNVYGEYRFSSLAMPPPKNSSIGRLSGQDMSSYMRTFAETFLKGHIQYAVEVKNVRRPKSDEDGDGKTGWLVDVESLVSGKTESLYFSRIVMCTGGCHVPFIPDSLSPLTAHDIGFKGRVFHSSQFRSELDLLQSNGQDVTSLGHVVIVGGGKSAQDIASYLASKGTRVTVVFEKADAVLASPIPLPGFIRRSRFLSILAGHEHLDTRLEWFLHTTKLGAKITHFIWNTITRISYHTLRIHKNSPLRNAHSLFWDIRTNDEGIMRPGSFHDLVNKGKIEVIAPARAKSLGDDGISVVLEDGRFLLADTLVLATGYISSWNIFDKETSEELGFDRQSLSAAGPDSRWRWDYTTLVKPPAAHSSSQTGQGWFTLIYRGMIPAKNILNHDFAINGAVFTTNNGYSLEVMSHWISSYFLRDPHLQLPKTVEEAIESSKRNAAWMQQRHPGASSWINPSYSSNLAFWPWPQAMDDLLRDMGLKTGRSGGNWLTWPFKVIKIEEISTLREERLSRR
ncbi:FAD/NAD(P)-binding domain-containing protein [Lentinula raphanica]|nr:FAD/NAD(P)-binding domain-containing protein [Lentinula raphanica]